MGKVLHISDTRGVFVYQDKTDWTSDERLLANSILKKIAYCQDQGEKFPPDVFESFVRSKKNIVTGLAVFNDNGQVYLVQKTTLDENSPESYSNKWYIPTTIHGKKDFFGNTLSRLTKEELGGVALREFHAAGQHEVEDEEKGMCCYIIVIAKTKTNPINPRGRFYNLDIINFAEMTKNQSKIILPIALRRARDLHWVS